MSSDLAGCNALLANAEGEVSNEVEDSEDKTENASSNDHTPE